jgi:hypothetical protein
VDLLRDCTWLGWILLEGFCLVMAGLGGMLLLRVGRAYTVAAFRRALREFGALGFAVFALLLV